MDFMDAKLIAQWIVDGLASIPECVYLSAVRTWESQGLIDRQTRSRNEYETERFFRAFKALASSEAPIRQLITVVITDFYSKLDENGKKAINDKMGYSDAKMGSRTGAQFYLTKIIADKIIARVATTKLGGYLLRGSTTLAFNAIMIQGIIEEAARASRRLGAKYPSTYMKVSPMNLDMVYFLVEKPLEPYLMYNHSHPIQCKGIQDEICKILGK